MSPSAARAATRWTGVPFTRDLSVLDPRLHARARRGVDAREMPAQHEIEAPPGVAPVRGEGVDGHATLFTVRVQPFRLKPEATRGDLIVQWRA